MIDVLTNRLIVSDPDDSNYLQEHVTSHIIALLGFGLQSMHMYY